MKKTENIIQCLYQHHSYLYTTDGNKQKEKHTERISNKNIHITAALWLKKETHKRLSNVNISP